MKRITLEDYLKNHGSIHCGMNAKSNLIDNWKYTDLQMPVRMKTCITMYMPDLFSMAL